MRRFFKCRPQTAAEGLKLMLIAWLLFFGFNLLWIGIDYGLRLQQARTYLASPAIQGVQPDMPTFPRNGIPEPFSTLIVYPVSIVAIASLTFLYKGCSASKSRLVCLVSFTMQAFAAFVLYSILIFAYVVGTGVDSL